MVLVLLFLVMTTSLAHSDGVRSADAVGADARGVDARQLTGPVRHIVAFNFLPNVTEDKVQEVVQRYLALRDLCVDPNTKQQYIISFTGGTPNSQEGFQQGMRLVFQMLLPNLYLRDYFVGRPFTTPYDPFHDEFKAYVGPLLLQPVHVNGLIVLDWVDGDFAPLGQRK
jgi:hypothetical protein